MITGFSRINLEVPDLAAARQEYANLLGTISGDRVSLANVEIHLAENRELEQPRISSLSFLDTELESAGPVSLPGRNRGLTLSSCKHRDTPAGPVSTGIVAVDHVVLRSNDADDCIEVFGEPGLGLRLALDQMVPEWGGRMLFFRSGKMTLEVIQSLEQPVEQDHFWGITYLTEDIDRTLSTLDAKGVAHSPVRDGRKPGTRVSTIKSHTLGLPTLLIEPAR